MVVKTLKLVIIKINKKSHPTSLSLAAEGKGFPSDNNYWSFCTLAIGSETNLVFFYIVLVDHLQSMRSISLIGE